MKRVIAATLLLSVFAGSVALADDRDYRRDHGRHSHERHYQDRNHRYDHNRSHYRHHDRRDYDRDHRHHSHRGHYVRPHYGHHHHRPHVWRRGAYLPPHYRRPVYIVHDYHVHRLRRPPRGYHWVRVDRDIVLTALATGLILEAVYNRY